MNSEIDKENRAGRNKGDELNERQWMFIDNYIITENATESYCRAYEMEDRNTAGVGAARLMRNERIRKEIETRREELKNTNRIATPEDVLIFLTQTMTSRDERTSERIKAAELIGKTTGMFVDRVDVNQTTDFQINLTGFQDDKKIIEHQATDYLEHEEE